jgi:hypothetical protein
MCATRAASSASSEVISLSETSSLAEGAAESPMASPWRCRRPRIGGELAATSPSASWRRRRRRRVGGNVFRDVVPSGQP